MKYLVSLCHEWLDEKERRSHSRALQPAFRCGLWTGLATPYGSLVSGSLHHVTDPLPGSPTSYCSITALQIVYPDLSSSSLIIFMSNLTETLRTNFKWHIFWFLIIWFFYKSSEEYFFLVSNPLLNFYSWHCFSEHTNKLVVL